MLTEKQKLERKNGIGGSDAAAILGRSRYKTKIDIYQEKIGIADEFEGNRFTHFGNLLEPVLLKEYERVTGHKVEVREETFHHKEHDFIIAHIDGFVPELNKLVEIKTANQYTSDQWGETGTDEVPEEYLIQCLHYLSVFPTVKEIDLAVLIGGNDFRIFTIKRDDKLINIITHLEVRFWEKNVLARFCPSPESCKEASDAWIKKASGNDVCIANDEIVQNIHIIHDINKQIKALQIELDAAKLRIMNEMKEKEILSDGFGNPLATWKRQITNRFDTALFKQESSDMYDKYLKISESRTFLLKKQKD